MKSEKKDEPLPSAIYLRVSPTTHIKTASDLHASLEESLKVCKSDAEREGNPIVAMYIDEYVSGKSSKTMPEFSHMLQDARDGTNTVKQEIIAKFLGKGIKIEAWKRIYCRRVNRFGRNRADMIRAEIELTGLGISIKFVESGVDTAKPFGKSIMAILSEIAEGDRIEILENTQRGRARAKADGVKLGQPRKEIDVGAIRQLRKMPIKERSTWRQLEKMFNVSRTTMIKRLDEAGFWDKEKGTVK